PTTINQDAKNTSEAPETPRNMPIKYVTAAATVPMPSIRNPLKNRLRPVKTETTPPRMNRPVPHTTALATNAALPESRTYGMTGMMAPVAHATKELAAASQGDA